MKLNKRLTSYPILSKDDDDYIDSYFDVSLDSSNEFGEIKTKLKFTLNNTGLFDLISAGKANYVTHFECSLLGYRKVVKSTNENIEHIINLTDIDGIVEISTFIVATENIESYCNEKFNWEYGKIGFSIQRGNILAIGPSYNIEVDRSKDGLKKLSDIICIKQHADETKKESFLILENDVIIIYVNENMKNQYYIHGRQFLYTVISMVMVPAMIYILTQMKNNRVNLCEYKWFSVIEKLLNQNNIDIDKLNIDDNTGKHSVFEISQKIFKSPLERGFYELDHRKEEVENVKSS